MEESYKNTHPFFCDNPSKIRYVGIKIAKPSGYRQIVQYNTVSIDPCLVRNSKERKTERDKSRRILSNFVDFEIDSISSQYKNFIDERHRCAVSIKLRIQRHLP
jgi:hypothetical protein